MATRKAQYIPLYGGYYQTDEPPENEELTHVGPGTPGGEYLRCFWHPVAVTSEVTDVPLLVRIMGEDLVLFRDLERRYGLLHQRCVHRGASLEYGKCEQRGLRCCYHGWLWDVDGGLLEAPGEPANTPLLRNVRQGAYRVEIYKGIVFAYLGPPESCPDFPVYDTFDIAGNEMVPYTSDYPCNWLQIFENAWTRCIRCSAHPVNAPELFRYLGGDECKRSTTRPGAVSITPMRVGWKTRYGCESTTSSFPTSPRHGAVLSMDGKSKRYFGRPVFTRWVVPVDNKTTRVIAWANYGERFRCAKREMG